MLLKGQNPQNVSNFVLNKLFQWSKAPLFSWKPVNKIKILQTLEENPQKLKENPQKLKENPQKLKQNPQKTQVTGNSSYVRCRQNCEKKPGL